MAMIEPAQKKAPRQNRLRRAVQPEVGTASPPVSPDPIEIAMGLERGDLAADVLRKQAALIDAQVREIRFNHGWRTILRGITVGFAGFLLVGLIAMVWEASRDSSLIIRAFSAPPGLTARGLSGEVIAAKLQDGLNALDRETRTVRASRSYANDWEGDIRVEVPETGISLGELRRTLRDWLGNATSISGSVFLESGLVHLEVRVNGKSFAVSGDPAAINPLVDQLALAVFADTQPQRYTIKLFWDGREAEAFAILERLETSADPEERYWSLTTRSRFLADQNAARTLALRAIAERERGQWAWASLADIELTLGHHEASARATSRLGSLLASGRDASLSQEGVERARDEQRVMMGTLFGDHAGSDQVGMRLAANQISGPRSTWRTSRADLAVLRHERLSVDTATFVAMATEPGRQSVRQTIAVHFLAAQQAGNPAEIVEQAEAIRAIPPRRGSLILLLAEAYAKLGRDREADEILASLPADNYERWRSCGRIATLRRNWTMGDACFREAIRQAPSIPRGYHDYGTMLAAKGDLPGAALQFALAARKGPRWADPFKSWGDVLVRQGKLGEARQRYLQAVERAPAWRDAKAALERAN